MKKINANKLSLSKEYLLSSSLVMLAITLTFIWIISTNYSAFKDGKLETYKSESEKIVTLLNDSFGYVDNFARFLGEKISQNEKNDVQTISQILITRDDNSKIQSEALTWTLFDFVDTNGYVTIAADKNALRDTVKVPKNKRSWMIESKKLPWKLILDDPDTGLVSGEYIIPSGFGITNEQEKFLGTLSVGFNIPKLTNKIRNYLTSGNISFIIINQNYKVILQSENNIAPSETANLIDYIKNNKFIASKKGLFFKPVTYGNSTFSVYSVLEPYNYIILVGENKLAVQKELQQIIWPQIAKTLSLGLVFVTILYFFGRKIVSPMAMLSKQALLLAQGNINIEIPKLNSFEADNLAKALYLVKDAFIKEQETSISLAKTKDKLEEIIQELNSTQKALELSNESLEHQVRARTSELETALSVKTEFLNNMSHEIRTPIQGVTVISQGLVEHWNILDEDEKFDYAQQVASNAERLGQLVGGLLDLSRFENGAMILHKQRVDFNQLILEMIEECRALYLHSKWVEIEYQQSPNNYIEVDKERIGQVLRNIFTNAIKFSPEDGKLIANLKLKEDQLEFSLSDEGIGIPEDELGNIFTAFYQSSRTKTKAGGTGLGLSISKEIIKLHAGKIWAENNEKGSTFYFSLPIGELHKIQTQSSDSKQVLTTDNKTILIIDDEEACLSSMELLLLGTNYQLIKASAGNEGLELLKSQADLIDIILLDLMLPDIYGIGILTHIKQHPEYDHIKIILQSGSSDKAEIDRAYTLGIDGYIKKPYQKAVILAELNKLL